jgi:hypothetical protein
LRAAQLVEAPLPTVGPLELVAVRGDDGPPLYVLDVGFEQLILSAAAARSSGARSDHASTAASCPPIWIRADEWSLRTDLLAEAVNLLFRKHGLDEVSYEP